MFSTVTTALSSKEGIVGATINVSRLPRNSVRLTQMGTAPLIRFLDELLLGGAQAGALDSHCRTRY